jgi:hypothetical protein
MPPDNHPQLTDLQVESGLSLMGLAGKWTLSCSLNLNLYQLTKAGGQKERKIVTNKKGHHICRKKAQGNTENCHTRQDGRREKKVQGRGCIDLSIMLVQV